MAMPLPADRLVIQALEAGVAALVADSALFARLLAGYSAGEITRLRARFLARRPAVRGAFSRSDDPWPTWAVALGDEQPEQDLLGNQAGLDPTGGAHGLREFAGLERQSVGVYVHCEHPDETRVHYLLVKSILRGSTVWLLQQGLVSVGFGGGRDLRPDEIYLPETAFSRMQTWELVAPCFAYEALPAPHTQILAHVTGITVDGHAGHVSPEGE